MKVATWDSDRAVLAMLGVAAVMLVQLMWAGAVFWNRAMHDHWFQAVVAVLPVALCIGVVVRGAIAGSWNDDTDVYLAGCGAAAWSAGALLAALAELVLLPGWQKVVALVHLYV